MNDLQLWSVILGGTLVTFAARLSFIALIPPDKLPPFFRRGLRLVPPAILSAFVLPELVMPGGRFNLTWGNDRLLAGILAGFVAWKSRNIWLSILTGMISLWILSRM